MTFPLRLLLAVVVLVLLGRAAVVAWDRRALVVDVWRSVRPRHVLAGVGLVAAIITVTTLAIAAVPALGRGLGDLVGTAGNAVFAPVDVVAEVTGGGGPGLDAGDVAYLAVTTLFLVLLVVLLPWLAFVEEEVFRAGAEAWSLPTRIGAALVFGAAHLVMLIPVGAALGIAVAGFAYGEVYRRGVTAGPTAPHSLRETFRSTRRSRAALREAPDPVAAQERQVAGVHRSTVLHTAANTVVVALVWLALLLEVLAR